MIVRADKNAVMWPAARTFAACFFGLASAAACRRTDGSAPPETPVNDRAVLVGTETRVHPIGEFGQARDYTLRVESVLDCPTAPPFSAKHGDTKFGVEIAVEGTSKSEVPVNPFYATVVDEGGDTYSSTLAGCEPGLPSVRVVQGTAVHGFVTFEIPKTSRRFELRYAPLVIGAGVEELRFRVDR
jgi:hypothetical protein